MDEEGDLKKAVSKAKKAFFRKREKNSKFMSRKETRRKARLDKKNKKSSSKATIEEPKQDIKIKDNQVKIKKKKKKAKTNKKTRENLEDDTSAPMDSLRQEEDKVITAMEKKLKLKRKKTLPTAFINDGLDYLLEVCEPFMDGNGKDFGSMAAIEEGAEGIYSPRKKQKLASQDTTSDQDSESDGNELSDDEDFSCASSDTGDPALNVSEDINTVSSSEDDFDEAVEKEEQDDKKGNVEELEPSTQKGKYIPPQLRNLSANEEDRKVQLDRIRKLLKGNLNRLSEANLHSIVKNVEEIYSTHSRNDVNKILAELITGACITPNAMPDRLIMEHIMLVAVLNESVGNEVGANLVQILAEKFHKFHQMEGCYGEGKECNNTVSLLSQLYNFKVIDSLLIGDITHELVEKFSEADIEMILLILKTVGAEIRRDDPSVLKGLILEIQGKAMTQVVNADQSRVRFMLEILTALRNNNLRKIPNYDPDSIAHARKVLRQILKGKDGNSQLRISLKDLLAAKDRGRWWVVGSAWSGETPNKSGQQHSKTLPAEDKLMALAKQQRMTTDIKKKIFCLMMSSEDYLDAFEKLLKLNLKEKQAREIVHVLVDCCLQEKTYNPFYAYLGQKLCDFDKAHKVTFQYSFWDRFKMISAMKTNSRRQLASLIAYLLASQSISLAILKVVSFATIDKDSINFFKDLLSTLILQNPERIVRPVFLRIAHQPKLSLLREGLKVFIEYFLLPRKSDHSQRELEGTNVNAKVSYELIENALSALDGAE